MAEIHSLLEIEKEVIGAYRGHHQYDWIKIAKRGWTRLVRSTSISAMSSWFAWIITAYRLPCIRDLAKRNFIHDALVETPAVSIATRFYPIGDQHIHDGEIASCSLIDSIEQDEKVSPWFRLRGWF